MQTDRSPVHFRVLSIAFAVCTVVSCIWGASSAAADTLYSYTHPFDTTSGTCPDPVLEISVVYDEAIPPNTPTPGGTSSTPGFVSYEFSACGEVCDSQAPCFLPGGQQLGLLFQFGTDANGDIEEWEVGWIYRRPGDLLGSVTFSTAREIGGMEGDLYWDLSNSVQGTSTSVGSWTVTEFGGGVPASQGWARVILIVALLAVASSALFIRRAPAT